MGNPEVEKLYEILDKIDVTNNNADLIEDIRDLLSRNDFEKALKKLQELKELEYNKDDVAVDLPKMEDEEIRHEREKKNGDVTYGYELVNMLSVEEPIAENDESDHYKEDLYPRDLRNLKLESIYLGLLIRDPRQITMYWFKFDECLFSDSRFLNLYKNILFTEGQAYAPEEAKKNFNFGITNTYFTDLKYELKKSVMGRDFKMEKVYTELKKLFMLRKHYNSVPIREIQNKICEVPDYVLYNQMTVDEVVEAIDEIRVTEKFHKGILSTGLSQFLMDGDNTLTNGIALPFPILTKVFKGVRQQEIMCYSMPSNAGKSRFTINFIAFLSLVHKKKVFIISNEMTEEKMKLCLITTVLNNPTIQQLHGKTKLHVSENQLLEQRFRPDDPNAVEVDDDGFIKKIENEDHEEYLNRLRKYSTEFNDVIFVTDWMNKQIDGYIYFTYITDHTNEELRKLVMNYFYRYKIEYFFYDTLKTDIDNIGVGEELKKTATLLSNLAQTFDMFCGSSLQLQENKTPPLELNVTDLSVSKTVKEVLDTLYLFKQIHNEYLDDYEYSHEEVDTKFFPLEHFKDPDVRYYACVVDKNRAGPKPKLLFRLNLAYNYWEELGYLRLKPTRDTGNNIETRS